MKEKIKSLLKIALLFVLGLMVSCDKDNESFESVELPILTTLEANNITSSSANSGGLILKTEEGKLVHVEYVGTHLQTLPLKTLKNLKMVLKLEVLTAFYLILLLGLHTMFAHMQLMKQVRHMAMKLVLLPFLNVFLLEICSSIHKMI